MTDFTKTIEAFRKKFYSKEYGLGYSMVQQPTTATMVVEEFLIEALSSLKAEVDRSWVEKAKRLVDDYEHSIGEAISTIGVKERTYHQSGYKKALDDLIK